MTKILYCIALIMFVLASCQTNKKEESNGQDTAQVASVSGENQLTDQQKAEGWILLFNGQNTEGWRFYKNKENNSWEVVDGSLHSKPFDNGEKRADLLTVNEYENFELAFDWKIPPAGNSGVIFRVTEEYNESYLSGPEYQVIDDIGWPGDPLKESQLTGSNYDMHAAPADKPVRPVGEWNSSRLVVNGKHVEHWLNGTKLLEYELHSPEWEKLKAGSKWKDEKGYGMASKGYIAFQDHGQEVWFKNILIKPL